MIKVKLSQFPFWNVLCTIINSKWINLLLKKLVDFLFGIEIAYFYIGKVVCNEKCKHDLGRGFFSIVTRKNYLLHPTSSGFESRATHMENRKEQSEFFIFTNLISQIFGFGKWSYTKIQSLGLAWLTLVYRLCYTVK